MDPPEAARPTTTPPIFGPFLDSDDVFLDISRETDTTNFPRQFTNPGAWEGRIHVVDRRVLEGQPTLAPLPSTNRFAAEQINRMLTNISRDWRGGYHERVIRLSVEALDRQRWLRITNVSRWITNISRDWRGGHHERVIRLSVEALDRLYELRPRFSAYDLFLRFEIRIYKRLGRSLRSISAPTFERLSVGIRFVQSNHLLEAWRCFNTAIHLSSEFRWMLEERQDKWRMHNGNLLAEDTWRCRDGESYQCAALALMRYLDEENLSQDRSDRIIEAVVSLLQEAFRIRNKMLPCSDKQTLESYLKQRISHLACLCGRPDIQNLLLRNQQQSVRSGQENDPTMQELEKFLRQTARPNLWRRVRRFLRIVKTRLMRSAARQFDRAETLDYFLDFDIEQRPKTEGGVQLAPKWWLETVAELEPNRDAVPTAMLNTFSGTIMNDQLKEYMELIPQEALHGTCNLVFEVKYHAKLLQYTLEDDTWRHNCCIVNIGPRIRVTLDGTFRDIYEMHLGHYGKQVAKKFRSGCEYGAFVDTIRRHAVARYDVALFNEKVRTTGNKKQRLAILRSDLLLVYDNVHRTKVIDVYAVEEDGRSHTFEKCYDNHFAHTFTHYTYKESGGKLLAGDLQGFTLRDHCDKTTLVLTDPTIHSRQVANMNFGSPDRGLDRMRQFFTETHPECDRLCQLLGLDSHRWTENENQMEELAVPVQARDSSS